MDIAIVGAGPIGLFAAHACGMIGLRAHIFEHHDAPGGQCNALYPTKPIYDIPGMHGVTGAELTDALMKQLQQFKPVMHFNTRVTDLHDLTAHFTAVIIASGFGACVFNRLALESVEKYDGTQVLYIVKDISKFAGSTVTILGGGNSAADWALEISTVAKRVNIVHRRDAFTAFKSSIDQLRQCSNIHFYHNVTPEALVSSDNINTQHNINIDGNHSHQSRLTGLALTDSTILDTDFIIPCYGMRADTSTLAKWGLTTHNHKLLVNQYNQTSIAKIYAIGDVAYSEHKTKLFSILAGFYEASVVVNHLRSIHFPYDQDLYSTGVIRDE